MKKKALDKRIQLWLENPNCYFCKEPTIIVKMKNHQSMPGNAAVLFHLYNRNSPMRLTQPRNGERRLVLACHKCANNESRAKDLETPIGERWAKSQSPPRWLSAEGGE